VLIVDDSAPFRQAARELLERRGYRVVGEADSAAAGLAAVERVKPDAVLLDVRLPDGSGLDLCDQLTREQDAPAVLLVSSGTAPDDALARAHGARLRAEGIPRARRPPLHLGIGREGRGDI
jgi:CheY-like chemotaxis protein